jgi:hypothetical protein
VLQLLLLAHAFEQVLAGWSVPQSPCEAATGAPAPQQLSPLSWKEGFDPEQPKLVR